MGFLDRRLGYEHPERLSPHPDGIPHPPSVQTHEYGRDPFYGSAARTGRSEAEVAVERYRYLLRSASPERLEEAHTEAFERLSAEQRNQVLAQLGESVPSHERSATEEPHHLARMATRAEMRSPGTLERNFGASRGPGFGSILGASMLGTIGSMVIGSAVATMMFGDSFGDPDQDFTDCTETGDDTAAPGEADAELVEASNVDLKGGSGGFFGGMFDGNSGGLFGGHDV